MQERLSMTESTTSPEVRFLCDEMLTRLARWLRAAGYDTVMLEIGESDGAHESMLPVLQHKIE